MWCLSRIPDQSVGLLKFYAGQPDTRPRVTVTCLHKGPRAFSPRETLCNEIQKRTREERAVLNSDPPLLAGFYRTARETDYDDTKQPCRGHQPRPVSASCEGSSSLRHPHPSSPDAGRRVVPGGGDKRELAHDHNCPAPP